MVFKHFGYIQLNKILKDFLCCDGYITIQIPTIQILKQNLKGRNSKSNVYLKKIRL